MLVKFMDVSSLGTWEQVISLTCRLPNNDISTLAIHFAYISCCYIGKTSDKLSDSQEQNFLKMECVKLVNRSIQLWVPVCTCIYDERRWWNSLWYSHVKDRDVRDQLRFFFLGGEPLLTVWQKKKPLWPHINHRGRYSCNTRSKRLESKIIIKNCPKIKWFAQIWPFEKS